jgi:putative flippase GtrA
MVNALHLNLIVVPATIGAAVSILDEFLVNFIWVFLENDDFIKFWLFFGLRFFLNGTDSVVSGGQPTNLFFISHLSKRFEARIGCFGGLWLLFDRI